jgi:glycosyltransferase involved in cell wall biosynthesis
LVDILGERAIILQGEFVIGTDKPSSKEANSTFRIPLQYGLLSKIKETKPDVLIGDGFFQWTIYALLISTWKKIPIVVCYERTAHTERNAQWFRKLYRKFALKYVDAVCCNGKLSLEYTMSLGYSKRKITTGHMAADNRNLEFQAKQTSQSDIIKHKINWQTEGIVFLFIGQIIHRKGVQHLLEGWKMFENAFAGKGTLVLVGAGDMQEQFISLADKSGLKNVKFVGHVDYSKIGSIYAAANVFIMPTLEDNWSLVVPEAMSCGLPILTSVYNGCWPELVKKGKNGLTFDPYKPTEIFKSLEYCVQNKIRLKDMGEFSKSIVKQYSPEKAAASILRTCNLALLTNDFKR